MQPTGTESMRARTIVDLNHRFLVVLISTVLFLTPLPAESDVHIVFRYDDFSADDDGIRSQDQLRKQLWQAEQNVDTLFEQHGLPYVISIIPNASSEYGGADSGTDTVSFGEDHQKVEFVKGAVQARRVEVAQHGFSHINHADPGRRPGEFRERGYESQFADITSGKEILCRCLGLSGIATFVPPWNGWDGNTAAALNKNGFSILSADRLLYYPTARGLTVIPCTTTLQRLESILDRESLLEEGVMVVLFHPYEIVEVEGKQRQYFGITRLDKLLGRLSVMPDVKVATFEQLARDCDNLTLERYRRATQLFNQRYFWQRLLPKNLWPGVNGRDFYLSLNEYSRSLFYWRFAAAGLVFGLFAIGLVIRQLVSLRLTAIWRVRVDIIATVLFALSILKEIQIVSKGWHPTAISGIPAFLTAGFVLALLIRVFKNALRLTKRIGGSRVLARIGSK